MLSTPVVNETKLIRIDNDDKLREKVDEALNVYDEYVKNAGEQSSGDQEAEGKAEEPAEAEPEPVNV